MATLRADGRALPEPYIEADFGELRSFLEGEE